MAVRKTRASIGPTPEAEAAAEELLGKGNAVDAVVAAAFAAAAASPGILLGPVQILAGGAGAGLLAVDGRVRQPGIGAPRPRGFVSSEEIPDAAWVGVPWMPAALSVANATMGSATLHQVMGPAIAIAKGTPRHAVLKQIAARGPRALEEGALSTELLAAAGRPSGGLLTIDDLASPHPEPLKGAVYPIAQDSERNFATFPWVHVDEERPAPPAGSVDIARTRAICAVDWNGTFAVACWDDATDGLFIEELGLRAPFLAEPVRRGHERTRPGTTRPASGPAALVGRGTGIDLALAAFGAPDAYDVLAQALDSLSSDERIEAHGEARLVAVAISNGVASTVRS
jgi:hypothetical protein